MKRKAIWAVIIAMLVVCIVLCTALMTACGEGEPKEPEYMPPKNCDVVLECSGAGGLHNEQESFIAICDSYEDIQEAFALHGNGNFESKEVCEYIDGHSEDKSLVVCYILLRDYSGPYNIREVEVNDGTLTMQIKVSNSTIAFEVLSYAYFIAGVDKSLISEVTECEYVFV